MPAASITTNQGPDINMIYHFNGPLRSIYPSIQLPKYLSPYVSICLSIQLSTYVSVYLKIQRLQIKYNQIACKAPEPSTKLISHRMTIVYRLSPNPSVISLLNAKNVLMCTKITKQRPSIQIGVAVYSRLFQAVITTNIRSDVNLWSSKENLLFIFQPNVCSICEQNSKLTILAFVSLQIPYSCPKTLYIQVNQRIHKKVM